MGESGYGVFSAGHRFHGRYEIARCLKAGGMGAVYEVVDEKTRRRRALKVMLPTSIQDADLRARFGLEATITAGVESDHIIETFDADIDPETGSPFIVMELLKGEDLGGVLERRGHLPPEEVVQLLGQLALALDKTHAAGIVHRDLKPENLFLTRADDGTPRLKVLDFGIAKVMASTGSNAATTRVMGTPLYMPKEQITGDGAIGPPADLYAVAHIGYTLLTGQAYWQHEAQTATAQYVFLSAVLMGAKEPATTRASRRGVALPPAFDAWFMRATALEPELRFERASMLVSALGEALGVARPRASVPSPEVPSVASDTLQASAITPVHAPTGATSGASASAPTATAVAAKPRRGPQALALLIVVAAAVGAAQLVRSTAPAGVARAPAVAAGAPTITPAPAPLPTAAEEAPQEPSSTPVATAAKRAAPAPRPSASPAPTAAKRPAPAVDDPTTVR